MSADELVIDVRGVVKRFGGKTVVNGIDLQVHRGEILGLTGLVGMGHDEVPYLVYGAERAEEGEVVVGDKVVDPRRPRPDLARDPGGAAEIPVRERVRRRRRAAMHLAPRVDRGAAGPVLARRGRSRRTLRGRDLRARRLLRREWLVETEPEHLRQRVVKPRRRHQDFGIASRQHAGRRKLGQCQLGILLER